jgi:hypothetical protein
MIVNPNRYADQGEHSLQRRSRYRGQSASVELPLFPHSETNRQFDKMGP